MSDLEKETKEALLFAIKEMAPGAGTPSSLESLSYAYSLVVGAKWGYPPGGPTTANAK